MALSAMDLIMKYSLVDITIKRKTEGEWDGPAWMEGEDITFNLKLPAFYLDEKDMQYYEGLNYTTEDLKIYAHDFLSVDSEEEEEGEPKETFQGFKLNDEVEFDGHTFVVDSIRNRSTLSDFFIIVAKKQAGTEGDNDD